MISTEGSVLGYVYCAASGKILRPAQDNPQRRHSAGVHPSIKSESVVREDD